MHQSKSGPTILKTSALLTAIALMALSGSALADSYYFRSQGSVRGTGSTPTANLTPDGTAYRSVGSISGHLSSTLANPVWSFAQNPTTPSLNLEKTSGGFSGTAPAVSAPTQFQITATATNDSQTVSANQSTITIYPLLAASGGPSGEVSQIVEQPLPSQPDFALSGIIGTPSYTLLHAGQSANIGTLCSGLSFSSSTGKIFGTPSEICSVTNLRIRVQDSFDNATIDSSSFDIVVTPANPTATVTASQANLNLANLFDANEWTSDAPKLVIIPAGVTIYSQDPAIPAITTGNNRGGALTLRIDAGAEIQAAGGAYAFSTGSGAVSGSSGGTAIKALQGAFVIQNAGAIRAGGGSGGTGGRGSVGLGGYGGYGQGYNKVNIVGGAGGYSQGPTIDGGGTGGTGGTWGSPGNAGGYGYYNRVPQGIPGAGGLAGYAVEGPATYSGSGVKQGR